MGDRVMATLTLNGDVSGFVNIASPTTPTSYTITLPIAAPSTSGAFLSATTAGVASWTTNTFPSTAAAGTVLAAATANTITATATPVLGIAGTTAGTLTLSGLTSGTAVLQTSAIAGSGFTWTFRNPGANASVGYLNIPAVGTKTSSYQLTTADIGEYVQVGTGGSITIPDATFAEGDVISIFNNTSGNITITCSITTAYIAGTDSDKATMTLATRGLATVLFISSTVCVVSGNVS
jgi:hypothetical protein